SIPGSRCRTPRVTRSHPVFHRHGPHGVRQPQKELTITNIGNNAVLRTPAACPPAARRESDGRPRHGSVGDLIRQEAATYRPSERPGTSSTGTKTTGLQRFTTAGAPRIHCYSASMTVALDISWRRSINTWISGSLEQDHTVESI